MINFYIEMEHYRLTQRNSDLTVAKYIKELLKFCDFLAQKLHCHPSEVLLDRIYTIRDVNNSIIAYKPLDAQILDGYLMKLSQSCLYSQLALSTHALRSFFKYIKKNRDFPDIISTSNFSLSHYRPNEADTRVLSRHEFLKFLHSLVTHSDNLPRDALLFCLLFSTGCRINEILTLKISSINLVDEMFILIKTKTKVQRTVVLRKGFGKILKTYLKNSNFKESDHLFVNEHNQEPLKRQEVDHLFKSYLQKANLPPMKIHSIRHSYATFMRDAGTDLFTIMELLGHESFQSTLRYTQHYLRNPNIRIKEHDEVYAHLRSLK
ncbi:Tyrosine recombinase XerC [Paenibacillus auburnensis]|uniref:Tyrosine recombinase XerC n=1 Tax=Paenibacillus auburnensis TaxID=2905649 RepID=A0ABM9CBS6_9BACL|nr:tyrosine-type recombinase/integrase [Paenibacillus auburnensis]CAH1208559.1 Tyrosine recombinase XerC [Paenibacillus auburnensis]